jgi:hypothetical protein
VAPQALNPLFVASYDSQGYGGGIRRRSGTDRTENVSSVIACFRFRETVFTELFLSSGCRTLAFLHGCYLAYSRDQPRANSGLKPPT